MRSIKKSCLSRAGWCIAGLLIAIVSSAAALHAKPPAAPEPPTMTLDDGRQLVNLARSAMREFVKSRTPADKYPIPAAMKPLTRKFLPASVTLRSSGKLLSRCVRADTNVCRSVVSAALTAMRSPNLPDRITPAVLAKLTVEIEVEGPVKGVRPGELGKCMIPGLTGVKVSAGGVRGHVLPSTQYRLGLSADQARVSCLAELIEAGYKGTGPGAWSIFRSKHYVGYPDATVIQLFRGKILILPEAMTTDALSGAAAAVGLFLANAQKPSGIYSTPDHEPALHEHLYATYAMAKLAKRDGGKLFALSVNRALAYAARFVLADDKQARVLASSSKGRATESPTRATAWLLLAITELPDKAADKKLAEKLARALQQDVVSVVGPDHELATADQLLDWSAALLALRRFLPKNASTTKILSPMHKTMQAWSKSGQVLSPMVLRGTGTATSLPKWRQVGDSDLPDRRGGFISSGPEPTTFDTAIAAVCLTGASRSASLSRTERTAINKQILRARMFCHQMLYRSREAYWTPRPVKMLGGMRASPGSSKVRLDACAAAIEAFLLK